MPFKFKETEIPGVIEIEAEVFEDRRGNFMEIYKKKPFQEAGIETEFVQDNRSISRQRVLRGLHFQKPPHAQAKLVHCTQGEIFDIAVDLREDSNTFGEHVSLRLSEENNKIFYIPRGFAHGFQALSDRAEVLYKVDSPYVPESEGGIIWNDQELDIDWPLENPILSEEDRKLQTLQEYRKNAVF